MEEWKLLCIYMPKANASLGNKRYWDLPGVVIDEANVPSKLRVLLPFAQQWSMIGDDALEHALKKYDARMIAETLRTAVPLKDAVASYAFESPGAAAIPVPDEVVLYQMFYWALCRLETETQ
jgi:hypothetical protein